LRSHFFISNPTTSSADSLISQILDCLRPSDSEKVLASLMAEFASSESRENDLDKKRRTYVTGNDVMLDPAAQLELGCLLRATWAAAKNLKRLVSLDAQRQEIANVVKWLYTANRHRDQNEKVKALYWQEQARVEVTKAWPEIPDALDEGRCAARIALAFLNWQLSTNLTQRKLVRELTGIWSKSSAEALRSESDQADDYSRKKSTPTVLKNFPTLAAIDGINVVSERLRQEHPMYWAAALVSKKMRRLLSKTRPELKNEPNVSPGQGFHGIAKVMVERFQVLDERIRATTRKPGNRGSVISAWVANFYLSRKSKKCEFPTISPNSVQSCSVSTDNRWSLLWGSAFRAAVKSELAKLGSHSESLHEVESLVHALFLLPFRDHPPTRFTDMPSNEKIHFALELLLSAQYQEQIAKPIAMLEKDQEPDPQCEYFQPYTGS
jgi:hypothetical protein